MACFWVGIRKFREKSLVWSTFLTFPTQVSPYYRHFSCQLPFFLLNQYVSQSNGSFQCVKAVISMRPGAEGSSRRYSTVLDHQSKQSFFLRTNPTYQFKDLCELKLIIEDQTPQPTAYSVFNVLKRRYSKAVQISPVKGSQTQRQPSDRSIPKQGSLTTRSAALFHLTRLPKSPLFHTSTARPSRRSKVSRLSRKLSKIDAQCELLKSGLRTERLDTNALRRAAAADIEGVRESLESKIAESGRNSLPASMLALRSRRTQSQPEPDGKVNLEVAENLREYKQHLWRNAVKLSLKKEMRYVYTMGTCTVLPETL